MKFVNKVGSLIKERDLFAIPVQLTYNGQRRFNTCIGGCCTILIFLTIMITFPLMLFEELKNPTVQQTEPSKINYLFLS